MLEGQKHQAIGTQGMTGLQGSFFSSTDIYPMSTTCLALETGTRDGRAAFQPGG